ncbi:MAG: hypothetical protein IPM18_13105 [Phycisphaerales bacterium]|nr:hypothetical protein [Phycisphaerales bacterium]
MELRTKGCVVALAAALLISWCPPVQAVEVGITFEIHQDILDPAFWPNDFHLVAIVCTQNPNLLLVDHLPGPFDPALFSFQALKLSPDPDNCWWMISAQWARPPGIGYLPYCTVLRLGLLLDVGDANVIIHAFGWWTRDGIPVGILGPQLLNMGFVPLLGFDVQDQQAIQVLKIGNGLTPLAPHPPPPPPPGPAPMWPPPPMQIELLRMDVLPLPPGTTPPFHELYAGGPQEQYPWVPIVHPSGAPISPLEPLPMPGHSHIEVILNALMPGALRPQIPTPIEPGGFLLARQWVRFRNNSGSFEERWFFEIHGAELREACCLPDGTCVDVSRFQCLQLGGDPQGPGTVCANTICLTPMACCMPEGYCLMAISMQCISMGGNPVGGPCLGDSNGNGVDDACELPEACCLPDGTCLDVPPYQCQQQNGQPMGPGTQCSQTICPQPEACCLPNGSCVDVLPSLCMQQGGRPMGPGTNCMLVACPQPPPNDNCPQWIPIGETAGSFFDTTWATLDGPNHCQMVKNIWYCYTATCTGTATISLCGSSYDTKLAVYHDCACYLPLSMMMCCDDNSCGLQSQCVIPVNAGHQYLIEIGGTTAPSPLPPFGPGVLTITCVGEPESACCLPDGSCVLVGPAQCMMMGGRPVPGQVCLGDSNGNGVDDVCELPEACCLPDGTCLDVPPYQCQQQNGQPMGPGTQCSQTICPQPEACCLPNGSCVDVLPSLCMQQGGRPMGPGTNCMLVACPQPPPNDNCPQWIPIGETAGSFFDTTWATLDGPNHCQMVKNIWYCYTATCTGTATISLCGSSYDTKLAVYHDCACYLPLSMMMCCDDNSCGLQSQCVIPVNAGHQYLIEIGGTTAPSPLPPFGPGVLTITCVGEPESACCLPDGSCVLVGPAQCMMMGGRPVPGQVCLGDSNGNGVDDVCELPEACCLPDGTCLDVPPYQCQQQNGQPMGPGTQCSQTICPQPIGACCYAGFCTQVPRPLCVALGGTWFGPGSQCTPQLCVCLGDLNCDTVVNFGDISLFIAAIKWAAPPQTWPYNPAAGVCAYLNGDFTGNGIVAFEDISPFIAAIKNPPPPCTTP